MRVKFQGQVQSIERTDDGNVVFTLNFKEGRVTDTQRAGEAKAASLTGQLKVKQVIANELKIGSVISVIVQDGLLLEDTE